MFLQLALLALVAGPALAAPGARGGTLRSAHNGDVRAQAPFGGDRTPPLWDRYAAAMSTAAAAEVAQAAQAATSATTGKERYDGHQVWRVDWSAVPSAWRDEIVHFLESLHLDIWRVSAKTLDVRLPGDMIHVLSDISGTYYPGVTISQFVPDVQALIDGAGAGVAEPPEGGWDVSSLDSPFHDAYHTLDDLYSFGDALDEHFGDMLRSFEIGQTAEGRPIRAWTTHMEEKQNPEPGVTDEEEKLEIIITAGQHAREWVSASAAIYFLHGLLLDAEANPDGHAAMLLKVFTITVVPLLNPDGYTYSHEHSRLWKKNRQNVGGLLCKGIDLNGNWGYQFQPSRLACSDSYKGSYAFEAFETRAMSNYIVNGTREGDEGDRPEGKVKAYVDLHSYGQLFMFPFAYSCADFPPDAENLMEAGLGVAKAMRTTEGQGYQCGQACDLTYRSTGESIDYTYGSTDIRWSYSAELRDTGTFGFVLPPRLIRPTGAEISAGLRYLATFIYETEIGN